MLHTGSWALCECFRHVGCVLTTFTNYRIYMYVHFAVSGGHFVSSSRSGLQCDPAELPSAADCALPLPQDAPSPNAGQDSTGTAR